MKPWKTLEPGTKFRIHECDGVVLGTYWCEWDGARFSTCYGNSVSVSTRWIIHKSHKRLDNLDCALEQLIVEYGI